MVVLLAGLGAVLLAGVVLVPAILDSVNGPRFSVPGSRVLDLEEGTWVLFELTGRSSGGGGVTFSSDRGVSVHPGDVAVSGPAPVQPRSDLRGFRQTITRRSQTYTGAVRFEIEQAGAYEIAVNGPRATEVLVSRPLSDLVSYWPWFISGALGGIAAITGFVMWLVGAANRRSAKRAGVGSAPAAE